MKYAIRTILLAAALTAGAVTIHETTDPADTAWECVYSGMDDSDKTYEGMQ